MKGTCGQGCWGWAGAARLAAVLVLLLPAAAQPRHEITITGTSFLVNGEPFPYNGINFFNAIYNPSFNKSSEERRSWIRKFQKYGINVLRVWGQWDSKRGFVDSCPECSLYNADGSLRTKHVQRLKEILADCDEMGQFVALSLFCQESWHDGRRLGGPEADRAVAALTHELTPHRNLTFQIWSEFDERVLDHLKTIKSVDPKRLVTNAPGGSGVIHGGPGEYEALDYLTPHTTRQRGADRVKGRHWEIAPMEIAMLLARYRKPVVDDSPARNGIASFGGPGETTYPFDHVLQIYQIWRAGGYTHYQHDMFQTGYGTPPVPPSGIPDPEFSPYHRLVLEFMALRDRYRRSAE